MLSQFNPQSHTANFLPRIPSFIENLEWHLYILIDIMRIKLFMHEFVTERIVQRNLRSTSCIVIYEFECEHPPLM